MSDNEPLPLNFSDVDLATWMGRNLFMVGVVK